MSLGDVCGLQAYHEIKGTPKPADYNNMALRIGKALEPMIVQMLADNGLDLYFVGEDQLEIAHEDPYRPGHPDGLASLTSYENLSPWLMELLPGEAVVRLLSGDMPVLEVKALNNNNWKIFMTKGLDMSNSLMRKYYGQCQEYAHTLASPKADELWESGTYRALLASGKPRPAWVLFVAYNKETQAFGSRIIEMDTEFYERSNSRIHLDVVEVMHRDEIPAPTYDGRGAECFWCSFKHLCPAAAGVAHDLMDLEDMPLTAPTDPKLLGHLDGIAARYRDNVDTMARLKKEQEDLRAEILSAVESDHQLFTSSYRVKHGTVKGRRNLDTVALAALAAKHGFEIPYKVGERGSRVYVSALAFPEEPDDDE